jgi:uncharacterized phage protein gp47/JayE
MINRVLARTDLTDINDGSSLKQVLAAAAREDDDQYAQMVNLRNLWDISKARGDDLDERAKDYNPNIITRRLATRATGNVQFSRTGTTGTVTIPIGTQVQVPSSGSNPAIVFSTTAVGTIAGGSTTSGLVSAQAVNEGASGNAYPNTITGFVTKPSGVDAVNNPAAFVNGLDKELDDSFRRRILAYINSLARCHIRGVTAAVMDLEDPNTGKIVTFAQLIEDTLHRGYATLYIDDGLGSLASEYTTVASEVLLASAVGDEVDLYPAHVPIKTDLTFTLKKNTVPLTLNTHYTLNPCTGHIKFFTPLSPGDAIVLEPYSYYSGLIQLAQKVVEGDKLDRVNYAGYRAAGVQIQVLSPQVVFLSVSCNLTILTNYVQATLAASVKTALAEYINGLGIGEDVILSELIKRAKSVVGVFDVTFSDPSENRIILDDQIARILVSNITVT